MPGKIVSRDEWLVARQELLVKEKAAVRAADALSAQRRAELPMIEIEKEYILEGPNGKATLLDMFEGRKQLIIYHFMLAPEDEAVCPGCSFMTDSLPSSLTHLNSRDTTFALLSRGPLAKLEKFKKRMGWEFPWYSSFGTEFSYDFPLKDEPGSTNDRGPGFSVFWTDGGKVYHTYSTYSRGVEAMLGTYKLLDMTPLGRQDEKYGDWKLHDEYTDADTKRVGH